MTVLAVCGFPRCGSTMTMRMLHVGGIAPVAGSAPGSYELPEVERVNELPADELDGHAVKLLDFVLWLGPLRDDVDWKVLWLDRDPAEQTKSNLKLMRALAPSLAATSDPRRLQRSYRNDRAAALVMLRSCAEVLVLSFESTLADPMRTAQAIEAFVAPDFRFDPLCAAAIVTPRGPECADGLDDLSVGNPDR